ncbi:MAG: hypothetical protein AB7V36_09635 [Bacteroidales bacterium]
MDLDQIFKPLSEVVSGEHRPHLYSDDIPLFDADDLSCFEKNSEMSCDSLNEYFKDADSALAHIEEKYVSPDGYFNENTPIDIKEYLINGLDADIPLAYNHKTLFYYNLLLGNQFMLEIKFKIQLKSAKNKKKFYQGTIKYLQILLKELNEYEDKIKCSSKKITFDANAYAIFAIRTVIIRNMAFVESLYSKNDSSSKYEIEKWVKNCLSKSKAQSYMEALKIGRKSFECRINEKLKRLAIGKHKKYDLGFIDVDFSREDVAEYINEWIYCIVSVEKWKEFKDVNVWDYLMKLNLSDYLSNCISSHQKKLYEKYMEDKYLSRYINDFNSTKSDKNYIAKSDLKLIDALINNEIDDSLYERQSNSTLSIRDMEHMALMMDAYKRDSPDYKNEHYDINSENCLAQAEAILKYKNYLMSFLGLDSTSKKNGAQAYQIINYSKKLSDISYMLNSLQKDSFIHDDTDIKEFRKIFNNTPPSKPIVWTGYKSELVHFIKHLKKLKIIKISGGNVWQVTFDLFVDENGNKFSGELKGQKKPAKFKLLEIAAESLK